MNLKLLTQLVSDHIESEIANDGKLNCLIANFSCSSGEFGNYSEVQRKSVEFAVEFLVDKFDLSSELVGAKPISEVLNAKRRGG